MFDRDSLAGCLFNSLVHDAKAAACEEGVRCGLVKRTRRETLGAT